MGDAKSLGSAAVQCCFAYRNAAKCSKFYLGIAFKNCHSTSDIVTYQGCFDAVLTDNTTAFESDDGTN